jgi:undecaprenyl phosphate N,N'-diacetylbacillosamine 1-phosphate transferase
VIKRAIEFVASPSLLILLSPILIIIAVAVKLDSKGPIIFRQRRIGRYGKEFTIYKFRTMYVDTDPLAESPDSVSDKRITRVGKIFRRFNLDEFLQLYNILKGDMSFVGPRPQLKPEMKEMEEKYPELCKKRLLVRPGLTCPWAIMEDKRKTFPSLDMLETDAKYVDEQNWLLDIKIILKTIIYLLKGN